MMLADILPKYVQDNAFPLAAAAIVLIGLFVVGLRDLARFSLTRAWAISSVCFAQSIRRKVLWITPLVIAGVLIVAQFQKPVDQQDAIRQTTVYCLFATGLLVAMVTIILACTNLPKEIENRVIYTVATKPTTRLEIVVGKIIGFVRVSFWILLIMGIFTLGYLQLRDWQARTAIAAELDSPTSRLEDISRPTLEYYRKEGTLHAREIGLPEGMAFYGYEPTSADDRWAAGGDGEILVRFPFDRALIQKPTAEAPQAMGPGIPTRSQGILIEAKVAAKPVPGAAATRPTTNPTAKPAVPRVSMEVLNNRRETMVTSGQLGVFDLPPQGGLVQGFVPAELLDRV